MAEKFNYDALFNRMEEYRYNRSKLAEDASISRSSLSGKLNGHGPFTQTEIKRICALLDIPDEEVGKYFFTKDVRKTV